MIRKELLEMTFLIDLWRLCKKGLNFKVNCQKWLFLTIEKG